MTHLEYMGYRGSVEIDMESKILYGKVLGISDYITYEGFTPDALENDFIAGIDSYLETCALKGKEPERPSCIGVPCTMQELQDRVNLLEAEMAKQKKVTKKWIKMACGWKMRTRRCQELNKLQRERDAAIEALQLLARLETLGCEEYSEIAKSALEEIANF